jgi:hypothetical protein
VQVVVRPVYRSTARCGGGHTLRLACALVMLAGPLSAGSHPQAVVAQREPPQRREKPRPAEWIWGVTVTDPWETDAVVEALERMPRRMMARVVFDESVAARKYVEHVAAIHRVADVMGEILDSQYVRAVDVRTYIRRTAVYLDVMGDEVDVWEIGNEINGEWLGRTKDVVAKMKGAYELVKARHKRAALTFHLSTGCHSDPRHEMFRWAQANVPESMKEGLDYVFVSYYEDRCKTPPPDWQTIFIRLGKMFPRARLGIGECGFSVSQPEDPQKAAYLRRVYGMRVRAPRFVGGFFYWQFNSDMVPTSRPLWKTLHGLVRRGAVPGNKNNGRSPWGNDGARKRKSS